MRCECCRDKIEGEPLFKDGMVFCSLECSDDMESGETMPAKKELLDDPSDYLEEEDEYFDDEDDDEDEDEEKEMAYNDGLDDELFADEEREH